MRLILFLLSTLSLSCQAAQVLIDFSSNNTPYATSGANTFNTAHCWEDTLNEGVAIDYGTYNIASTNVSKERFLTNFVAHRDLDFVKSPGAVHFGHLHTFVNSCNFNESSTFTSLMAATASAGSGRVANKTAYWFPSLVNYATGTAYEVAGTDIYYVGTQQGGVYNLTNVPNGLRFTGNGALNTRSDGEIQRNNAITYNCVRPSWNEVLPDKPAGSYGTSKFLIPACDDGDKLTVQFTYPDCWNGVLDANDGSNLTYDSDPSDPSALIMKSKTSYTGAYPVTDSFNYTVTYDDGTVIARTKTITLNSATSTPIVNLISPEPIDPALIKQVKITSLPVNMDLYYGNKTMKMTNNKVLTNIGARVTANKCDYKHPIRIPQIMPLHNYVNVQDLAHAMLSSDKVNDATGIPATPGASIHGGVAWAWAESVLNKIFDNCLFPISGQGGDCGVNIISSTERLATNPN